MKVREKKWIRLRIYLVAVFFLSGLGIITARAYQLQVLERDKLASIARAGYRGIIKLPPKRGTIYDRDGHELAISVEVASIYAHPKLIEKKIDAARKLSQILSEKQGRILDRLKSKSGFVWISRKVPPEKIRQVKALGIQGIGFTKESRRYYPGKEIAGHLIGFVGNDNQGLEGLEKRYDDLLRGPQQTLVKMRDAFGRPFFISGKNSSGHDMHNLTLTIDKDIQYKAQQTLQATVKKTKAKGGQCVVVNPETGEILAMAVVPPFNPNLFRQYRPAQWRNRAVTDCYEPGSVMKVFLLAAALEERKVTTGTEFDCEQGAFKVSNRVIHDTKKYDFLNVKDIIVYSSNIGAVKIGQELGYERFYDYLIKFGFGQKTGLDLLGERKGFIRPAKEAREIDRANLFFGQGLSTSSVQLAMAMAAISNGGKLMRPFVVKTITDQRGRVVKQVKPRMMRKVLSTAVAKKVTSVLEDVVSERGTGPAAAIKGYRAAGKTGTPQKIDPKTKRYSHEDYMAIFVGFVPIDKPKLVILVAVDEPEGIHYGGVVAGPVFREVGSWTLSHLRINPKFNLVKLDEEPGLSEVRRQILDTEPAAKGGTPGLLPDFRGKKMREVLMRGRALGLKVVLEGSGLAVKQVPGPGYPLAKTETVKVSFKPPS